MLRQFVRAEPKRSTSSAGGHVAKRKALNHESMGFRRMHERFAITFCEASVHAGGVGNEATGTMSAHGISTTELRTIQAGIQQHGGTADYYDLTTALDWESGSDVWSSTVGGHEGTRSKDDLQAGVLVIRNGAELFLGPGAADRLFEEQCSFPYDRLYYNSRQHKMLKKRARYNIEFGPVGKVQSFPSIPAYVPDISAPEFEHRMGEYQDKVVEYNLVDPRTQKPFRWPDGRVVHPDRKREWTAFKAKHPDAPDPVKYFKTIRDGDCTSTVKAFDELPLLAQIRARLGDLHPKCKDLFAEGNHYFGPKSNINYHGDGERKIIVCLCLGKSTKLTYQWRLPEADAAIHQTLAATLEAHHGDIYFMSEKAGGYDWKFGRNQWPEPRLVHGAAFEQNTLDNFMARKRAKKAAKK